MLRQWALWLKFDFEGTEQNMMILLFPPHSVATLKHTEASLRQAAMAKPSGPKPLHLLELSVDWRHASFWIAHAYKSLN